MGKFDTKITKQGQTLQLSVAGVIDEDADFAQLSINGAQEIRIDLNGVKSINSCGIREWIKWVGQVPQAKITYEMCPKVIVDQINMVDGFLPLNAHVTSFFVPYYNEETGSEKNVLFRDGQEYKGNKLSPPAKVVDEQGQAMEMDVIESKYFKFLNR